MILSEKQNIYKSISAAMFLFGNIALLVPYNNAKKGEFTGFILAFFVSLALYFLYVFILKKIKTAKIGTGFYAVGIVLIFLCLFVSAVTANHYIDYISADVLIKSRKIFSLLGFGVVNIFLITKSKNTLLKFSGITFCFTVISLIILLLLSFDNLDGNNFNSLFVGNIKCIAQGSLKYLYKAFLFPFVFAVFSVFCFDNASQKNDIIGFLIGFLMLSVCFLSATLTFSLSEASAMTHAYPISISVILVGQLFTRMDGMAYFIFFFSALIKAAICGFSVKAILEKMNAKNPTAVTCLLVSLSVLVSYIT